MDILNLTTRIDNIEELKLAVQNILCTPQGSMCGKPRYGSKLHLVAFSLIDPLVESIIQNYVYESLRDFEDRIELTEIKIISNTSQFFIGIEIFFIFRDDKNLQKQQEDKMRVYINL